MQPFVWAILFQTHMPRPWSAAPPLCSLSSLHFHHQSCCRLQGVLTCWFRESLFPFLLTVGETNKLSNILPISTVSQLVAINVTVGAVMGNASSQSSPIKKVWFFLKQGEWDVCLSVQLSKGFPGKCGLSGLVWSCQTNPDAGQTTTPRWGLFICAGLYVIFLFMSLCYYLIDSVHINLLSSNSFPKTTYCTSKFMLSKVVIHIQ